MESELNDPSLALAMAGVLLVAMGRWKHDSAPRQGRWGVMASMPSGFANVVRSGQGDVLVWSLVNWLFGVALVLTGALGFAGVTDPLIGVLVFLAWPIVSIATWVIIEVGGRLHP